MVAHVQLLAHLAKRGMDFVAEMPMANSPDMDRDEMMTLKQQELNDLFNKIPKWGLALVVLTGLILYILNALVMYTINNVIMTLAMVETPTVDYVPVTALDNLDSATKNHPSLLIDGEAHTVISNKPITSSIRGSIRHLTTQGGFYARWRGLGYAILFHSCETTLFMVFKVLLGWLPAGQVFASIISSVALARLHCAWTHKVIAVPSNKSFMARIPPRSAYRQLWIPNAIASASSAASMLVFIMLLAVCFNKTFNYDTQKVIDSLPVIALKLALCFATGFFLVTFVILPNYAARSRIEATLLPDDEDTIVPFDRTFGGKVTPVVVGGSGLRYVKEVCRTFDREARIRIIKLFLKSFLISVALVIVTIHIISFEMFFVILPVGKELAKKGGAHMLRL